MKYKSMLFSLIILLMSSVFVFAQSGMNKQKQTNDSWAQKKTEKLTKALNLTSDQQQKVLAIYQDNAKQMKMDKQKYADNKTEMNKARNEIRQSIDQKIEALLTPDQKTKFMEMHKSGKKAWSKNKQSME